jgi:hypothetical protein
MVEYQSIQFEYEHYDDRGQSLGRYIGGYNFANDRRV